MTGPPAAPPPSSRTSLCLSFLSYKARTQRRLPPRLLTPSRPPHHGEEEGAPQGSRFPLTPRMQCRASPLECPHHTAQPPELPPLGRPSAPSAALEAGAAPPPVGTRLRPPALAHGKTKPVRTVVRRRGRSRPSGTGARVLTAASGPTLGANPPPPPAAGPALPEPGAERVRMAAGAGRAGALRPGLLKETARLVPRLRGDRYL